MADVAQTIEGSSACLHMTNFDTIMNQSEKSPYRLA